jgi:hypothetical protein
MTAHGIFVVLSVAIQVDGEDISKIRATPPAAPKLGVVNCVHCNRI